MAPAGHSMSTHHEERTPRRFILISDEAMAHVQSGIRDTSGFKYTDVGCQKEGLPVTWVVANFEVLANSHWYWTHGALIHHGPD